MRVVKGQVYDESWSECIGDWKDTRALKIWSAPQDALTIGNELWNYLIRIEAFRYE